MSNAIDLRVAADLLERRGWCQGVAVDPAGRMCVVGALTMVGARCVVRSLAARLPGACSPVGAVIDWNDTPGRTQAEVLGFLRDTADLESLVEVGVEAVGVVGESAGV